MTKAQRPVAAIILAAGGSTRMGQLKQLLPLGGKPMVRRVVETACSARLVQVVVVVGARADQVREVLAGLPVDTVTNDAWAQGMSTSVGVGLRALRSEAEAALMVLADQPALTPTVLDALIDHFHNSAALIVAPRYKGQRGNPVLIDRVLFRELLQVGGDQGARALIGEHEAEMELVDMDHAAVVTDIDTHQDYETALETDWDD